MTNLYARTVFFVKNAERALTFYTEELGFSVDWKYEEEGRPYVFQVSLLGFELILNQVDDWTQSRAGHGRVFIGLDEDQVEPVRQHIAAKGIEVRRFNWGRSTLVIRDSDANELFFWLPEGDWTDSEMPMLETGRVPKPGA
jgi:catechol 2,3-dioxygenase-like lactoylglutathione lyase family enzyme